MTENRGKRHDPHTWVQIPPSPLSERHNSTSARPVAGGLEVARIGQKTASKPRQAAPKVRQMPDLGDFTLTTQEAARLLKMHVAYVRKLIREGKLKARHIGPVYLLSRQSVERYRTATEGMAKNDPRRGV